MKDAKGRKLYELGDPLKTKELAKLGLNFERGQYKTKNGERVQVLTVRKNLFTFPQKGDWYLSGAIATAYRAPHDFTSAFWFAELKVFRKVEYLEEIK